MNQPQQLDNEPASAICLVSCSQLLKIYLFGTTNEFDTENPNTIQPIVKKSDNTNNKSKPSNLEKKFNVIVYSIEENPPDTNRELCLLTSWLHHCQKLTLLVMPSKILSTNSRNKQPKP